MRKRLFNANLVTEGELESLINRLINELHLVYRLRISAPEGTDYDRKEQAAFLQLRLLEGLFPHSRHTHIRIKIGQHRWGKTSNKAFRGIKVIYDKDDPDM